MDNKVEILLENTVESIFEIESNGCNSECDTYEMCACMGEYGC